VKNQIPHPYQRGDKIMVLRVFMLADKTQAEGPADWYQVFLASGCSLIS
jgi:hypothetical protein